MTKTISSINFGTNSGSKNVIGQDIKLTGRVVNNSIKTQTINVNVEVNGNNFNTAEGDIVLNGVISGKGIVKSGNKDLYINGNNTNHGLVEIKAGKVVLGNANALGGLGTALLITGNSTLDLGGYNINLDPTIIGNYSKVEAERLYYGGEGLWFHVDEGSTVTNGTITDNTVSPASGWPNAPAGTGVGYLFAESNTTINAVLNGKIGIYGGGTRWSVPNAAYNAKNFGPITLNAMNTFTGDIWVSDELIVNSGLGNGSYIGNIRLSTYTKLNTTSQQISPNQINYTSYPGTNSTQVIVTGQLQYAGLGNSAGDFFSFVSGRIALVQRGLETFQTKVNNAISAGATGVVIWNDQATDSSPDVTCNIPVVLVSQSDGQDLLNQLNNGDTITFKLDGQGSKGGSLTYNGNSQQIISGDISEWPNETGTINHNGSNSLILTNNNPNFFGTINVNSGTLQVGNGGTTGGTNAKIINNSSVIFNRSNSYSHTATIQGTGSVTISGTGTVTAGNSWSHTGGTFINSGNILVINNTGFLVGGVNNNGNLNLYTTSGQTDYEKIGGLITGSGSFTKSTAATAILTLNHTYSGGTSVTGGTLQLGNGGTSGMVPGNITISAAISFNRSDDIEYSNVISGAGTVTKLASNKLTFIVDQTYTGATTVSAGTLQLGNGGTAGIVAGNIANNSSLIFNRSNDITYAGVISGAGLVDKQGNNILTLTGTNTGTGTISVSGTLQIGNGGSTGSITADVTNNGTLIFNRTGSLTYSGLIDGSGNLIKNASGTVVLTQNHTYSGGTSISAGILQLGNGSTTGMVSGNISSTGGTITFNRSDDIEYSNVISGVCAFTKSASNKLTFIADQTYTGATTVSAGTLQLGNGGSAGNVAGNITNSSALIFNRSDDLTYTGVISGTGSITKSGNNILTLTGASTNTGTFTISSGTLKLSQIATLSGTITNNIVNNGSIIVDRTISTWTFSGAISGSGSLTTTGSFALILTGTNTYTGGTTISSGSILTLGANSSVGSMVGDITNNGTFNFNVTQTYTFAGTISGTGTVAKTSGTPSTTILTANHTYSGGTSISSGTLQLGNGGTTGMVAGNISSTGGTIAFNRSDDIEYSNVISGSCTVTKSASNKLTFAVNQTYTGSTTISTGTLQLGNGGTSGTVAGAVVNNSELIFNRSDNLTFTGLISGTGNITQNGSGTVIFTRANTNTGVLTIASGTVQLGASGSNECGLSSSSVVNNGTLAIRVNSTATVSLTMAISGTGSLTKIETTGNTLSLNGNNTYTGGTIISAGTLRIGGGGTTGSIVGDVTNNAALSFNRSDDYEFSGVISGTGTVTKTSAGTTNTITLSGNNTYTGTTTIQNGTLQIGNGGTSGSVASNIIVTAGSITFNRSDNLTYSGVISSTGSVKKLGAGTLILTGTNTNTGTHTILEGTLQIGNGGTTGVVAGNMTNNSILVFNRSNSVTNSKIISGTGSVVHNGSGTTTLSGVNTYSGGTTINSGTLTAGNISAFGSGTITVNAGATLNRGGFAITNTIVNNGGTVI